MKKKKLIIASIIVFIVLAASMALLPDYEITGDMALSSGSGKDKIREVEIRATTFKFWKSRKITDKIMEENLKINHSPIATSVEVRLYFAKNLDKPFYTIIYSISK